MKYCNNCGKAINFGDLCSVKCYMEYLKKHLEARSETIVRSKHPIREEAIGVDDQIELARVLKETESVEQFIKEAF